MTATTAMAMVAEAKGRIQNLTAEAVARELEAGNALLVDLRESAECNEHGAIPGAIHAPRGMLEFYADPASPYHKEELDPSARIILYCASGGRSALSCLALEQLGYTDVGHLDRGFTVWKESGRPVEAWKG